jgi:hypothetical protein
MKALLILIVTVGTSHVNVDSVDSSLDVRQIEFESISACEQAASRLTHAGRVTGDWAKTFAIETGDNGRFRNKLFVAPPTIVAECVELG